MPSPQRDELSRIGPFALEEALGGDPRRRVLRAVHVQRGTAAAVKLLDPALLAPPLAPRGLREDADRLTRLHHPGIARVYGLGVERGRPYLALELVEGETLRQRLDRLGRLGWEAAAPLAEQACEALVHAHEQGVVHRRLTPEQILLTADDHVKLVGFDCVWADRDAVLGLQVAMSTAHYLAPEAFRGKASAAAPACDLFSLGVVLFECLTGRPPWAADAPADLIRARRAAAAPRASSIALDTPVWLDVLVARLLECDRRERWGSAEALRQALADARHKVAHGMGTVQHAWSGRRGRLAIDRDRAAIHALRKTHRTREPRPASPFYERAWFLAACLIGLAATAAWALRPASEDRLIDRARPLMASDKPADWRRAQSQYLDELLDRFPDTRHAAEIAAFQQRYAVHRMREKLKNLDRFGRLPESEAQRRCAQAWYEERTGDLLSAWQQYAALADALEPSQDLDEQALRRLALEGTERIRRQIDEQTDGERFIEHQLRRADDWRQQGDPRTAAELLQTLVALYGPRPELADGIALARQRLAELESERPPLGEGETRRPAGGDDGP